MWYPGISGGVDAIGYAYSDDEGINWTKGGNNPVASRGASNTADPDFSGIGDVTSVIPTGDVLVSVFGQFNLDAGYAENPSRGIGMGIVPRVTDSPVRSARFYDKDSTQAYTSLGDGIVAESEFTLAFRFRAFGTGRDRVHTIYAEEAAFNIQCYVRITTAGKLTAWYRTPSGIAGGRRGVAHRRACA
jgi:hypothetical protein